MQPQKTLAGSLAWKDRRFSKLPFRYFFSTFHQCRLGLFHAKTGLPVRKSTTIFAARQCLVDYTGRYQCDHRPGERDHLAGTYQGRSVTSWAEDYPKALARALVKGMSLSDSKGLGHDPLEKSEYEPPHFEEPIGHRHVSRCCFLSGSVLDTAYPAAEGEPTVFKIADPDIHKQLNALQFPGRYKQADLPVPVRAQLCQWTGLEVDTIVTSRSLKCYVNLPTGVVATRRTTMARVAGEWFYVDHCKELQSGKRLRLPLNVQLLVTFFGDKPASQPPVAAETQPVVRPVPGAQGATDQRKVTDYLNRLRVGLGHCGRAELLQHLKDAGAATWLVRQAEVFSCAVCDSQKPPDSHVVVGSARPRSFNSILAIDTLDLTLERDSVQYPCFLLTAVDTATSYARVFHLEAGDSSAAVQQLERGWFQAYGAPDYIFCDPDTVFRSEKFGRSLSRNSVLQRLSAAQSPWQHGQIEQLHRTLRQQAQRVFQADRSCSPFEAATAVMRVEGVLPAVLVFGKLPKAPPSLAEGDEDYQLLAERLHREDPVYETVMLRRVAARTAWVQSEVRERTARLTSTRPRPYKGP